LSCSGNGSPNGPVGTCLRRRDRRRAGSAKWFLRHGNVFRAPQAVEDITVALDAVAPGGEQAKLGKAIGEFDSYLRANAGRIPNYGDQNA
jgi:hypothetical protein